MSRPVAPLTLALAGLALGSLLVGCGGGKAAGPSTTGTKGGGSTGSTVQIKGFAFAPAALTVAAGTTVTWTQDDSTVHTVTDAGAFDSGALAQGKTWSYTFTKPGTYHYICSIHPYMKATVTVR